MTSDDYLIWSHEHAAWWKPDGNGYTTNISRAGVYTRDDALTTVRQATLDWTRAPNEIAVAVADLPDAAQRLLALDSGDAPQGRAQHLQSL